MDEDVLPVVAEVVRVRRRRSVPVPLIEDGCLAVCPADFNRDVGAGTHGAAERAAAAGGDTRQRAPAGSAMFGKRSKTPLAPHGRRPHRDRRGPRALD